MSQPETTTCILDSTPTSILLQSKIRDIPHKYKYEIILKELFDFCLSKDDITEFKFPEEDDKDFQQICNKIDWIRDKTFIIDQIVQLDTTLEFSFALPHLWNDIYFLKKALEWEVDVMVYEECKCKSNRELVLENFKFNDGNSLRYLSDELKNDFEVVKAAVEFDGRRERNIQYASSELRNNKELALMLNGGYKYLSNELKCDREVIIHLAFYEDSILKEIPQEMQSDKELILKMVERNYRLLDKESEHWKDREIVMAILKRCGPHLQFASEELRNDREIVETSIKQYADAIRFASQELRNNKDVVRLAIIADGELLRFASDNLKDDLEFVELAIEHSNGRALFYASTRIKHNRELFRKTFQLYKKCRYLKEFEDDREVAMEFVKETGSLFGLGKFNDDREIVRIALENRASINDVSSRLRIDRELCLIACKSKTSQNILEFVSDELRNDREFVLAVVRNNGRNLEFAADCFKKDREIVLEAAPTCGYILTFVDEKFKDDKEIVLRACEGHFPHTISIISDRLANDREVVLQAVKHYGFAMTYAGQYKKDREIVLAGVKNDSYEAYYLAAKHLRHDKEVALETVKQNWQIFSFLPTKLRRDKEIALEALKRSENLNFFKQYASYELRNDKEVLELYDKINVENRYWN